MQCVLLIANTLVTNMYALQGYQKLGFCPKTRMFSIPPCNSDGLCYSSDISSSMHTSDYGFAHAHIIP